MYSFIQELKSAVKFFSFAHIYILFIPYLNISKFKTLKNCNCKKYNRNSNRVLLKLSKIFGWLQFWFTEKKIHIIL